MSAPDWQVAASSAGPETPNSYEYRFSEKYRPSDHYHAGPSRPPPPPQQPQPQPVNPAQPAHPAHPAHPVDLFADAAMTDGPAAYNCTASPDDSHLDPAAISRDGQFPSFFTPTNNNQTGFGSTNQSGPPVSAQYAAQFEYTTGRASADRPFGSPADDSTVSLPGQLYGSVLDHDWLLPTGPVDGLPTVSPLSAHHQQQHHQHRHHPSPSSIGPARPTGPTTAGAASMDVGMPAYHHQHSSRPGLGQSILPPPSSSSSSSMLAYPGQSTDQNCPSPSIAGSGSRPLDPLSFYSTNQFADFNPSDLFGSNQTDNRGADCSISTKPDPIVEKEDDDNNDRSSRSTRPSSREGGKRHRGALGDTLSACWNSPLCPNHQPDSTTPDPSSCGAACAPFLFRDISPLPASSQVDHPTASLNNNTDMSLLFNETEITTASLQGWDSTGQTGSLNDQLTQQQTGASRLGRRRAPPARTAGLSTASDCQAPNLKRSNDQASGRQESMMMGDKAEQVEQVSPGIGAIPPAPIGIPSGVVLSSPIGVEVPETDDASKARKRQPHKQVERKYRESLNAQLESLRRVVPALQHNNRFNMNANFVSPATLSTFGGPVVLCNDDIEDLPPTSLAKPSKAVILATATAYIQHMEKEKSTLADEISSLRLKVKALQALVKCDDCSLLQYVLKLNIQGGDDDVPVLRPPTAASRMAASCQTTTGQASRQTTEQPVSQPTEQPTGQPNGHPGLPPVLQQWRQRQQLQQELLAPSP